MSQHSTGVSLHAQDVMINSDFGADTASPESGIDKFDKEPQCFYTLCLKTTCCKCIPFGKFKDRKHALYCWVFTAMMTCLFISIIAPMVLYALADYEIMQEVVIDSTSAPQYAAWQNNVYGDGKEHVQIKYNLYYFQVQNMAETLQGQRPKLMQVGPYAYDEYYVKFDIAWSDGGDTVTYNTQKYYLFNQAETGPGLSPNDQLTLPYATVIGFNYLLSTVDATEQQLIDAGIHTKVETQQVQLISMINLLYYTVLYDDIPAPEKAVIIKLIKRTNATIDVIFNDLYDFVDRSNVGDLLLKTMMCNLGNLSPFWKTDPYHAWFGWLNDPLLLEVQNLLYIVQNKTGEVIPWTSAVPGASTNWTSIEETRRRRAPDVFKTGKKNANQVGQYVYYQNMTELWTCVSAMESQNTSLYVEGEQFPACAFFQREWNDSTAEKNGYRKPFATPYANRIHGTDANAFGRPITSDKLGVFISDIYRSVFLQYVEDEDWNGVTTRRFGIQSKDMDNSTDNPANAQFYAFGPSGLENTTAATGVPVFVSLPHFLHGDDRLVAAVEGLNPNEAEHESNLDMEPQTGLLTQAHKRLQVNYQMLDKTFPITKPDTIDLAHSVCRNISLIISLIDAQPNATQIPLPDCNMTMFNTLFTCFGTPVDWKMYNGEVFFPYGWADEHFKLPDSDADDIHDSLFLIDEIGAQIQFWSLIAAGILFVIILAMLFRGHLDMLARGQTVWHAFDPTTSYKGPNNANGDAVGNELHNPIDQPREGAAYMTGKGAVPLLA